MKEDQGTNEELLCSKRKKEEEEKIMLNQLVAAALNKCPAIDMPWLWPTMGIAMVTPLFTPNRLCS